MKEGSDENFFLHLLGAHWCVMVFLSAGGLSMFYDTEESLEGKNAFMEKRKPDFSKYR